MKEVLNIKDVMELLGMSYATASKKIREIRHYSDRLNISGHIHRLDWEDYVNRFNKKDSDPVQKSLSK